MRTFDFTLRHPLYDGSPDGAGRQLLDVLTDPLFERFEGDVVPALIGRDLVLDCSVEADTLEQAARTVGDFLQGVVTAADRSAPAHELAGPGRLPFALRVETAYADLVAA